MPLTLPTNPALTIAGNLGSLITDPNSGAQAPVSSTLGMTVNGAVTATAAGVSGSGTLSAATTASGILIPVQGFGGLSFTSSGTWVGTMTFLASSDGGATFPWTPYVVNSTNGTNTTSTSNWTSAIACGGLTHVVIYFSAYTSGTATVAWNLGAPIALLTERPSSDTLGVQTGLVTTSQNIAWNGTNWVRIRADLVGNLKTTRGGATSNSISAGTTQNAIKTGNGRLYKVVVTVSGTGTAGFWDFTTTSGGIQILAIPASAPAGTIYDMDWNFFVGLSAIVAASGPTLAYAYD